MNSYKLPNASVADRMIHQFYASLRMVPVREAMPKSRDRGFSIIGGMRSYTSEDSDEATMLIIPTIQWFSFLSALREHYDGRCSIRALQQMISNTMSPGVEWPLPDADIASYSKRIIEWLEETSQLEHHVLVPTFNLWLPENFEVLPLANCELYRGSSDSLLAIGSKAKSIAQFVDFPIDSHFLLFKAFGDAKTVFTCARAEMELALAVLRYIAPWNQIFDIEVREENKARRVSDNPGHNLQILYYPGHENDPEHVSMYGTSVGIYGLTSDHLDSATHRYGLEDINYHFSNELNQISQQITRALAMYDSGACSSSDWQALYRFVAAINIALPGAGAKDTNILNHLQCVVHYGGSFVDPTYRKSGISEVGQDFESWDDFVAQRVRPFKELYGFRNRILHGGVIFDPPHEQVMTARILAHNCIRLVAKLARRLDWKSYREVKSWFRNPSPLKDNPG